MTSIEKPHTFRFGPFEADAETGELRKNGRKMPLQEKCFQVLVFLLERRGKLVSREELHGRLWPSDTFVDFDNGLNTAVSKLRDILGDSAEPHRYIETLPRRGYRFVASVNVREEPTAAPQREIEVQLKRIEPDVIAVEITGKLAFGSESRQVEWLISDLLNAQEKKVIFDISAVNSVDSTGLGIILMCASKLKSAGGELRVAGASAIIEAMLRKTELDMIVSLHSTRAAAVEAFANTSPETRSDKDLRNRRD